MRILQRMQLDARRAILLVEEMPLPSPLDKVKVTMHLLRKEAVALQRDAQARGISFTHALRIAIGIYLFLWEAHRRGDKILLEYPNGAMSRIHLNE